MKMIFTSIKNYRSELTLEPRMRMLRCHMFSVFLYSYESCTLVFVTEKSIDAFAIYLCRSILWISWTQKMTNIEVLKDEHKGNCKRKKDTISCIHWKKWQKSWLKDISKWFGCLKKLFSKLYWPFGSATFVWRPKTKK